jgi:hypothetical protein
MYPHLNEKQCESGFQLRPGKRRVEFKINKYSKI